MLYIYLYDGSFEGLMTAIYETYYSADKPEKIICSQEYEPQLIYNVKNIISNSEKSDRVIEAIKTKISLDSLQRIFHVYLSSISDSDTLIYNYIRLGFRLGNKLDMHLHNDIVLKMHKIQRKVTIESHNMLGFIRFKEIKPNLYYSSIEPDHNIISLLAPHFSRRLPSENWIIHDIKREIAAIYNCSEWVITPLINNKMQQLDNNGNNHYELLWKEYFNTLAIEERKNLKLQCRMMPRRYWKHLTELK
jgi:probable DNA metabolism protein